MTALLPPDFLWGFASASYQIEGAINEDGRGPSTWDRFCQLPGKIADGSSGEIACDSYHRSADDIALLKKFGAKAYRFSISWSRIIPLGGRNDPVNLAGLNFYVKFVKDLLAAGITPFVTLFHWDLPDQLQQRYGGLLNKNEFTADFVNYARIMFKALPMVKHWITFNEPFCSAALGYSFGVHAPGRTSDRSKSDEGDSRTETWIVGHSILVAHGHAVKLFRDDFKAASGGEIGMTLNGDWADPYDSTNPSDIAACERKIEFSISWFADPIYFGSYPASMVQQLGSRLPQFTAAEKQLILGSNDFYGMNHYCANYVRDRSLPPSETPPTLEDLYDTNGNVDILFEDIYGNSIGPETQSAWLRPHPAGFRKLLNWISARYHHPKIYVTENGTSVPPDQVGSEQEIVADDFRVRYFEGYVGAMAQAVKEDGVDVKAYLAWSLMDNFEWADGYVTRFGVTYVDYENGQRRVPKKSAMALGELFQKLIKPGRVQASL